MKNLSLKTGNTKGNEPKYKENLGFVTTFIGHSDDFIQIDCFEGYGKTFKKREQPEIQIVQNGSILFMGDKYELYEILINHKNN